MILGGEGVAGSIGASIVINNLSFFSVAFFGGMIGEQIKGLSEVVDVKEQHIQSLTHLNDLIVENIGTGLLMVNKVGELTYVNPAVERMLKVEGMKGKSVYNYLPGLRAELKGGGRVRGESASSLVRRSEIKRDIENVHQVLEVISSPTYDPMNVFHGYVILVQDLTKTKDLERAVRQKEKLAAVGQLAAGIAHEIRNPLASISGSIQLLGSEESSLSSEEKRLMRIVIKEIDRLNLLISDFLEYVRPSDMEKGFIDINVVLSEVLEIVRFDKSLIKDIQQKTELHAGRGFLLIMVRSSKLF